MNTFWLILDTIYALFLIGLFVWGGIALITAYLWVRDDWKRRK